MPIISRGDVAEHTWMAFVDGENVTIRGQFLASEKGIGLREGSWYKKDHFLWIPRRRGGEKSFEGYPSLLSHATRASYYTALTGSDGDIREVRESLWNIGFSPNVFKKAKNQRSKGVDIALCRDMLTHAFRNHYEVAVLVAGDGDYVPLVEQVKRLGKPVLVWFFSEVGLSPELRLASDGFLDLTHDFLFNWTSY